MFLTVEEIERLTGCKRKLQQCRQLDKMHISYFKNARNEPVVSLSAINGVNIITKSKGWQSKAKAY